METHFAFAILLLIILVITVAHIFACERHEKFDEYSGGDDDRGIMQYVVPVSFES